MNLEDMRRDYTRGGLQSEDLAADPIEQFRGWLDVAIDAQVNDDPTAMTIATVDADGHPSQRMVLLKGFDERGFVFYTNHGSRKAAQIAGNPRVCLHFGWLELERQVVIWGTAERLSIAESTSYFVSRPRDSQLAAWASEQSRGIGSRKLLEAAFEQVRRRFSEGEIPLPSFWGGYRVKPSRVEFWQGRANRLHDRFLYSRTETGWRIERLQP
ncbi:MAG: pyridoxamine 5'-phosphate oxidase [Pseudomonadota bacterium]